MQVVKNGIIYNVNELQNKWKISTSINNMPIDYEISKNDYATFDELKAYILSCDIF